MKHTSTQGRVTSNTRWILKRELKFFLMLPVWLMGLKGIWKECFLPLHNKILDLWNDNGSLWLTQYLAEVSRILVLWLNGTPYKRGDHAPRVRLTRSGLPVLFAGPLRIIFDRLHGEDHAYALLVARVTLTLLSVYRVIGCSPTTKLETITGPFTGVGATLLLWEVNQVVGLLPRMLVIGKASWTYMSESAGPNFKKSTWSAGIDALSFIRDPFTWYHWIMVAVASKAWDVLAWNLLTALVFAPVVPLLLLGKWFPLRLGRLTKLYEARGKVRIVAITDWWTQVLLKPLHQGLFDILRDIPQDGTFDQLAPVHRLLAYVRASGATVYSYDLSAATDRLPLAFQVQVLESLGVHWAKHWGSLLSGRAWYLEGEPVYYAVGQPMGALSSWAMLALSHHVLVQIAARRVDVEGWFTHYALLGDDIIIADEKVAAAYLSLMSSLGLTINLSKSFEMKTGGLEFAKRWISPVLGDLSPISPMLILASIRDPRILSTLIRDSLGRMFVFPTHVVSDLRSFLHIIRPRKWNERMLKPIFLIVFGPTGGLWDTASGPLYEAVWIRLFPHQLVDKFAKAIDTHINLLGDAQIDPLSVDESKAQLVSNYWKTIVSLGPTIKGLLWVPLSVFSPAFWVYYDHALQAGDRLKVFLELKVEFLLRTQTQRKSMILESLNLGPTWRDKHESLDRLMKDTFCPDLLDWKRKEAADALRHAIELLSVFDSTYKPQPAVKDPSSSSSSTTRSERTVPSTSSSLALVLHNGSFEQKITLRTTEVPMYGPSAPLEPPYRPYVATSVTPPVTTQGSESDDFNPWVDLLD